MTRAWFVGNGLSLQPSDLDLLIGEVAFASNRIHLLYARTDWRPDYLLFTDRFGNPFWKADTLFHLAQPYRSLMRYNVVRNVTENDNEVWWRYPMLSVLPDCRHHEVASDWHLPHFCIFGGPVNLAAQMAWAWGFDELYLIGCDLGYAQGKQNHFDPEYTVEEAYQREGKAEEVNTRLLETHAILRDAPIEVYNATRGGELEIHPRVVLEEVM